MQHTLSTSIMDEFADVSLGDKRLSKRLGQLAAAFAHQPAAAIPKATGNWAQACAAYRFLNNERITASALLSTHTARTLQRAAHHPLMLAVTDTTSLNYSDRPHTTGLGPIGNNADKTTGLLLHTLLAFTPDGQPLGVLDAQSWARDPAQFGNNRQRNRRPLADKESAKWLRSYEALAAHASATPQTRWVEIADREADLYDLFERAAAQPAGPALLIRAQHNRGVDGLKRKLFAHLARAPRAGSLLVQVPAKPGRRARTATVTVRFCDVRLAAPWLKADRPPLTIWAVEVREEHPPRGAQPLHWRLLSTLAVSTLEEAVQTVRWYCVRWGIEVFHKVLKSGCAVEAVQLESAARLVRCVMIKMVVAWQTMALSKLGREQPKVKISELLEESAWRVLVAVTHRDRPRPRGVPRVSEAVQWIGRLGGHLGRRGDGAPGPLTLARGLERLHDITVGWELAQGIKNCA
jgi:Transposase DNA-binding/Transposase Tn5 dimerisation domain